MLATRRTLLMGLGAAALAAPVEAQLFRGRNNKSAGSSPPAGPYAAAAQYSAARRGVALLVMQDGKVLFEDYPAPGGPEKAWELASGTKSFTGVMAALAAADGLLDIDEAACRTLREWSNDARRYITIRHLLTLTSGLDGKRATGRPPPYAEAITAGVKYPAGSTFEYGPTPFQCFGEIMVRKLKAAGRPADPVAWLQGRLFDRLRIRPKDWKRGSDGNPYMPQGAHFTARDWAVFGQWVMDGASGADPRVAAAWFESTKANPGYGLSWWLLRPGLIGPGPRSGVNDETIGEAAVDEDIVMAAGAGDQRLYLLRKRRIIVARQANQILRASGPMQLKWRDDEFLKSLPT